MRILVAGINIRHIVSSASRAGHVVYAADCYCDRDLSLWAKEAVKLPRHGWEDCLDHIVERFAPDAAVLGPGLEEASVRGVPVLSNPPEKTRQVSDKLWFARWLERKGFPFIKTEEFPEDMTYPFLVKPRQGAGGVGCRTVRSEEELQWDEDLIAQALIFGQPASVSVISNGREAHAIAVNEQLIGLPWTGASGFRYCGNITPIADPDSRMIGTAERIVAALGLVGSNGVDFLLTNEGPVPVEVNSRFQGSLDSVEAACGINVFEAHLQSFSGALPEVPILAGCTAGRAILYAPAGIDIGVDSDLTRGWTADVPERKSRISSGDPILSIFAKGASRDDVLSILMDRAAELFRTLKIELR
jgi:hypothetical protein